ncbi:MAG: glycerol-3-phosphate dehydrogenase [Betaproteobacteria bacterium RIFCSPLOWO2_02_FULL_62_17]|nr:MAG: glycerol-3-phosphate dehydrogenase [Betaproteobacteria bacterium RIFCSPLOWO2_02_FULL_62_17]
MQQYDLAIIGGGINGCGIARDAAGRGLSVLVAEAGDLAGATSSASTKLIHGGLRYLEYYEFRLVAEALAEREALLRIAPHIIWPLEFVLPHESHLRPAWMIRMGLFFYDHLGRRAFGLGGSASTLPASRGVRLAPDGYGKGLNPGFTRGFAYYDCWVDDARLVVLNARSAAARGARIATRTRVTAARRDGEHWHVTLATANGTQREEVSARALVNAAGPWVKSVLDREIGIASPGKVRLVRGSHMVVPRIHDRRHAFILQNPDRRIVFMIPYEREFTLIGTTDVAMDEDPSQTRASQAEIDYLCNAASHYTERRLTPRDVVWSYSGVRPLYDDGSDDPSAVTRDYHLLLDEDGPPLVSIFGGKITTYRRLAEHVMKKLETWFPDTHAWTATESLPGGDFGDATAKAGFDALFDDLCGRYPRLPGLLLARLARRHGTLARALLGDAQGETDLGEYFGGGLYEAEVRWFINHEWAREAEDVLWRRTKCGLHMSAVERESFAAWMLRNV